MSDSNGNGIPSDCFEQLESPHISLDEKFRLITLMQYEVGKKLVGLHNIENSYKVIASKIQNQALQRYKDRKKMELVRKYEGTDDVTHQMIMDFEVIDRREKMGCYHLNGTTVSEDDCGFCEKRKLCEKGNYIHTVDPDLQED